jgi:hypothetical protein
MKEMKSESILLRRAVPDPLLEKLILKVALGQLVSPIAATSER